MFKKNGKLPCLRKPEGFHVYENRKASMFKKTGRLACLRKPEGFHV